MADGLLRKKVSDRGLDIFVDSAGTAGYHIGEAPDLRMRETARKMGFPIDDLRARQFSTSDFDKFDLIYVMDSSNYTNVIRLARNEQDKSKVALILNEVYPNENRAVPDPYYGAEKGFQEVYDLLDRATDRIIEKLINGKR